MGTIRINYSTFSLKDKAQVGAVAMLMYSGSGDPKIALDKAVCEITEGIGYYELINAHLDNPWTRVLLTNVNDMVQDELNLVEHKLTKIIENALKDER